MKSLLIAILLLMGVRVLAAEAETLDLSFVTQSKIMESLIFSKTAQNTYLEEGEASYADVMERDLRLQGAGKLGEGNAVVLTCTVASQFKNLLDCTLSSYSEDESGESALVIQGKIYFPEYSSELYVSEVKVFIAG